MYDFTTVVNRAGAGSGKWERMKRANPDIPEGIVPLSVADMEFKTAPEIIRGLQGYLENLILGYAGPTQAYYDAVCGWMKRRHSWDIKPEWIVTSNGVVSAFFNAVRALTEPGDGVIIMPPVYYPFYMAIERNKRVAVPNDLVIKKGRYEINFADLEAKARDPQNKVLLFCSPHNPVGRVWEPEELKKIGDICLENKVAIISDEIHFDLIMPGYSHRVFATLGDEYADNMIICTAPSKTFNLAGMQSSNIIIKNPNLLKKYMDAVSQHMGHPSLNILGYKACELAYTQCEAWLDELLLVIDGNKKLAETFMEKNIPQIKVFNLEGTYLQWWDCRELGMDYKTLENFMIADAFLFLDEGYIFGPCGQGYERINLACPASVLKAALERFAGALKKKNII